MNFTKFEALTGYEDFLSESATGRVSFDLSQAITNVANGGYNTEGQFTVGDGTHGVFSVTKNSDINIRTSMTGVNGLQMYDAATNAVANTTINPGTSASFYFKIDTAGVSAGSAISGTIQVRT